MAQLPDIDRQDIQLTSGTRILWGCTDGAQTMCIDSDVRRSVMMHFSLAGTTHLSVESLGQRVSLHANQHSLFYPGDGAFRLDTDQESPIQCLQIQAVTDLFDQPSAEDNPVLRQLSQRVRARQAVWLAPGSLPVTPDMHTVLAQITACPLTCSLKRLFLEAKVLELLALQLEQYGQYAGEPKADAAGAEYDKVVEARHVLAARFDNPPTLPELSRLVGLNEFKLKKGFKAAFGETLYNWVLNYRLEQAYRLLQSRQLSVSEVAYRVGYQHPAHFTTAFKKKFGLVPSSLVAANE